MILPPDLQAEFDRRYKHLGIAADEETIPPFLAQMRAEGSPIHAAPPPVTPLADRLPGAAKAAIGGRVKYDKEWLEDVKRFKRDTPFAASEWQSEVRAAIEAKRQIGEPSARILNAAAGKLVDQADRDFTGQGLAVIAFRFLAWLLLCWPETARRSIRWLELHGHICTRGTRVREGKAIWNGPNAYVLQMLGDVPRDDAHDAPTPDDPVRLALSVMRRMARAWERWLPCFGLVARPSGWANASPLRQWKDDDPLPA